MNDTLRTYAASTSDLILAKEKELIDLKIEYANIKSELDYVELDLYSKSFDVLTEAGKPKYSNERLRDLFIYEEKQNYELTSKILNEKISYTKLFEHSIELKKNIDSIMIEVEFMKRNFNIFLLN